jgi:glutamate/tyrosine decarboxylase-like PLP-dependent enzyme
MNQFFTSGIPVAEVEAALATLRRADARWNDPRNLRASYFAGDEVVAIAAKAYASYFGANALYGALAYPSLPKLEAEVVEILLALFQAPPGSVGSITSGGTESIFMAVKTARDWARAIRPEIAVPNIVLARTAHAAFSKAADLLGIDVRRMAGSVDWRADVGSMAAAVDRNTIMIVGSAPAYAYGVIDPIEEIAAIAERHGLWMHVDACVGGMVLPFMRDLGEPVPAFDFALPAVKSLSVDLRKYGYAFHGCSALLLREATLAQYQRYHFDQWPVGAYTTTNLVGSRSGGPLASAWAVMKHLGAVGYRERVARMLEAKARLMEGIERIAGLTLLGRSDSTLLAFGSANLDMVAVGQELNRLGWAFARTVDPPGILLLLNGFHGPVVGDFLADLERAASEVGAGRVVAEARPAVYTI